MIQFVSTINYHKIQKRL